MKDAEYVGAITTAKLPILAAFCCYYPGTELEKNVRAASSVCEQVVIIDDGTPEDAHHVFDFVQSLPNVRLVLKKTNLGIANSFNIGFRQAVECSAPYYLTYDQDTVVAENQIRLLHESLLSLTARGIRAGVVGPGNISDESYFGSSLERLRRVPEIIQSAAIFRTDALLSIGGADESFVIDAVDTDVCLRLSSKRWGVYIDNNVFLEHAIGSGRHIRLFGRSIAVTNHSPLRRYYMTRNRLRTLVAHAPNNRLWALVYFRRFVVSSVLALFLETRRRQKFRAITLGAWDFLWNRKGKPTKELDIL